MNRPSKITGASKHELPRTNGSACAPIAPTPADIHYATVRDELLAEGFGLGTRCIVCRKNQAGCLCGYPEPEAEYFRPGINRDPDDYDLGEFHVRCLGDGRWRAEA